MHKIFIEIALKLHKVIQVNFDLGRKNAGYYRFGEGKKADNG